MNKSSSEQLSNFLTFVRNIQKETDAAYERVNKLDEATGDWKHQIELGSYKDRAKAATQLNHVLKERRQYKNVVDVNQELVTYLRSDEFKRVYKQLEQLLGKVRKQENYVSCTRIYQPRVVENLPMNEVHHKTKDNT